MACLASMMIDNHFADIDADTCSMKRIRHARHLRAGKARVRCRGWEKQTCWLRVRARGTAAHGSLPIPDNANVTLLSALQKTMAFRIQGASVVAEMIRQIGSPLAPNKYTAAIQANTVSLTTLSPAWALLPRSMSFSASEATLDCRLLPGVNMTSSYPK